MKSSQVISHINVDVRVLHFRDSPAGVHEMIIVSTHCIYTQSYCVPALTTQGPVGTVRRLNCILLP